MSTKHPKSQLHTPAKQPTAEEQRQVGMGGSYTIDPKAGTTELTHRTEAAAVSRKNPLTDADGKRVDADTPAPDATDA